MIIYQKKLYVSETGINIFENEWVSGESPHKMLSRFTGQGSLHFSANGQQMNMPFAFDVPGETVQEAFANFQSAAEKGQSLARAEFELKMREQQREASRKILLAGVLPPAGNPKTGLG